MFLRCWSNTSRTGAPVFIGILEDLTEVFEKTVSLANSDSELADYGTELTSLTQ